MKRFAERLSNPPGLRRLLLDRSTRESLFVFAVSRAAIFVIFVLVPQLSLNTEGKLFGKDYFDPDISLGHATIGRRLRETLRLADASWYMGIASEGYEHQPFDAAVQHKWAFFPLYPLLLHVVAKISGEFAFSGALLSNLLFFFSLIVLHKLTLALGYDAGIADRALFYLAFFPVSYFLSLPFTESLFLFLTVGSFYGAAQGKWWVAGAAGALASATRVSGVLLLPALLVMYWQRHPGRPRWNVLWLALVPAGLLSFMFYLWVITGNAWAFKDAHAAWGRRSGFFLYTLWDYVMTPGVVAAPWNFRLLNFAAAMLAFGCVVLLARRRQWAMAIYTLLSVLVPLSSLSLQSLARFVLVMFPVFIVLGIAGSSTRVDQFIRTIFVLLFGLMTALFAARLTMALA